VHGGKPGKRQDCGSGVTVEPADAAPSTEQPELQSG
jgi:hypothetical protein